VELSFESELSRFSSTDEPDERLPGTYGLLSPKSPLNLHFSPSPRHRECINYIAGHLFTVFRMIWPLRAVPAIIPCKSTMKENLLRFPKPSTVYRRIIENDRLTQKVRLQALAALQRPTRTLLFRLISDPRTPARLLALAAERYEVAILKTELRQNARQRPQQTTPTDN
jgi:hypothetical protein